MQPLTQMLMFTRRCELQFIMYSSMMTYTLFRFLSNEVQILVKITFQAQRVKREVAEEK